MSSHFVKTSVPRKTGGLSATVLPDGRWLLYNQNERTAVTLSASAGILWELCDGQTSVAELIEQLQDFYPEVDAGHLEAETMGMLHNFLEQGLVTNSAAPTA